MSEQDSSQEKTEDPTAKKKEKAAEDGQVPRSKELSASAILISGVLSLWMSVGPLFDGMKSIFNMSFTFTRADIFNVDVMGINLYSAISIMGKALIPMFVIVMLASFIAPIAMGSWNFSSKALMPKLNRLDPIKGLKKIFSVNSLMELIKSIAKFFVIAFVGIYVLFIYEREILGLANEEINQSIFHAIYITTIASLMIALSVLVIAAIDVPFQIWNNTKQLKMTKQEVKDEFKDSEGKPEVKGRIRQLQREIAQRAMMGNVPEADVVITNPTHFSVALRYNPETDHAPIMVAKGADFVALKIREIANHHKITIIQAPPLARAVYYNTEVDAEIPDGLYLAIAQVLAYVFRLNEHKKGKAANPGPIPNFDIPDKFHDEDRKRSDDTDQ